MKKCICFLSMMVLLLTMTGCANNKGEVNVSSNKIASICDMATLKCYYNNVAKYEKKDAEKKFLFWSIDRRFWVEYSGIVTFGIDASLVNIDIDKDNRVTITVPKAEIQGCTIDKEKFTEDCFYIEDGSAKIESKNVSAAMKKAQEEMQKTASENKALFSQAQERAKGLLKEYVVNFGEAIGVEYQVTFKDIDNNAKPIESTE